MKRMTFTFLIMTVLVFSSLPALAFSVVLAAPGTTQTVQSVSEVATGLDMAGMSVTVRGLNEKGAAFTDTRIWGSPLSVNSSPPVYGGVFPNGDSYAFYLFQGGDTHYNTWWLYSFYKVTLQSITIDALPGNAVFDRTIDGMEKTPGSGQGKDFSTALDSYPVYPHLATYRDQVALKGAAPQGDLYRTLDIQVAAGAGQTFFDSVYYELFTADTDRVTPVPTPVSSTLMLLGSGLLGLVGLKRKYFG